MTTPKTVQSVQGLATQSPVDGDTTGSGLDEVIQGALGRKLRESYDEVVREQVPDKFLQLLDQLKKSEGSDQSREG